jgi:signal transduction histidine kinase
LLPQTIVSTATPVAFSRVLILIIFAFTIGFLFSFLLNYLEQRIQDFEKISALNEQLNEYVGRLESTQKQLIQAEKLNAIGQLSASIAHEINNPLNAILLHSEVLLGKIKGDSTEHKEAEECLANIEKAVNHCSHIIKSLLDFSRQSELEFSKVSLSEVIREVVALTAHEANTNNITLGIDNLEAMPEIDADAVQLRQVFINLIINAIQSMTDGGRLTISGSTGRDGWLKIGIEDTGCGISEENLGKIFLPFFTTKEFGKGTGLGLAVSYGIIERHGGRIEVRSEPGKGSKFTVCLPL